MNSLSGNRFEDFYADDAYVLLKNDLYNYLLRRRAVRKNLQSKIGDLILEVGSGLSPMTDASERIVYSELSYAALQTLKKRQGHGYYVVSDAVHLPFQSGSFSQVICSEVLEHLKEDRKALCEMARVMKTDGSLVLTFPHRRSFFASDDRYVNHFRRYELDEMITSLEDAGLISVKIQKVLGPLEKITMIALIALVSMLGRFRKRKRNREGREDMMSSRILIFFFRWLNRLYLVPAWLDARLAPRRFSSVLLIRAVGRK
jgi:SAM-dependent methyltransferase